MNHFISSLILALAVLIPLGLKWEIKIKTVVSGALAIGLITGVMINIIIRLNENLLPFHLFLFEFFIILFLSGLAILSTFYRDPERIPPKKNSVILSPADGKLIYVKKIEEGKVPYSRKKGKKFELSDLIKSEILDNKGYIIGISMNFLNVHVNRSPIKGHISLIKHIKGRFFSLKKEDSLLQNERVYIVIKNDEFAVGLVQIASRLVRRIVTYIREGEIVDIGQRLGMIKFGSQVDVILPNLNDLEIRVKVGDELKAGISILAKYHTTKKDFKNSI